jgi:hypothetical protein
VRGKQYFQSVWSGSISTLIVLLCFYCRAAAQDVQVEARLDKNAIPIGEQTVLHISARIPSKSDIVFPQLKDSIGKIKIVSLKADTAIDKSLPGAETITRHYTITCFDTGVYVISGLELHTKTDSFKTGTVTLEVKGVPVDTTKAFYDIKQPFAVSYTFWDWLKDHWVLVALIAAALLAALALFRYLKNRPQSVVISRPAAPLTADAIALSKLEELRGKRLWQHGEVKLHYSELTDIQREYLSSRYHISTHEQTSGEILAALGGKDMPLAAARNLRELLTLADLVKFAKEIPPAERAEQSVEDAAEFVRLTREEQQLSGIKLEGTE